MRLIAAILVSIVALQGCVTDNGLTGTGPVTLTDRQKSSFEKWANGTTARDPLYFFLIRGGTSYWVLCPDSVAICRDDREEVWKQKCDAKYGTDACKLYGVYGDVVWRFKEPADPNWWNLHRPATPVESPKKFNIRWEGRSELLKGSMVFRRIYRRYSFDVVLLDETLCEGIADFTANPGFWRLRCLDGLSGDGEFKALEGSTDLRGEGRDSRGNRIEFRVGGENL